MICISYDRRKYQEDMIKHIKVFDNVVEIGCHVGVSTKIISKLCQDGCVYAYDNSPESCEAMQKLGIEHQNVEFNRADVRNEEVIHQLLEKCDNVDVLCIDLGGGYHPDTVFKVFFIWSSVLKPRVTLIRNQGLIDFINTSTTDEDIKSDEGYLQTARNVDASSLKELKLWSNKLD